jgi:hypothetical protein
MQTIFHYVRAILDYALDHLRFLIVALVVIVPAMILLQLFLRLILE